MAYEPSFERTDVIDALCMEIAELVGMLSPQTPLSASPTLRRELRIQTIYSSLVIEGNKLDERAVSAIIDGKRVLGDRRDILEVENARAAYDLIPSLDPYSVEELLRVHRVMMGGLVPDSGRFRSGNVGAFNGDTLIHAGTPAAYVPEVMGGLFEWLRTTRMHPLLASCVFHFEFEFCHPFSDGTPLADSAPVQVAFGVGVAARCVRYQEAAGRLLRGLGPLGRDRFVREFCGVHARGDSGIDSSVCEAVKPAGYGANPRARFPEG